MQEQWRPVPGFPDYEVSNIGGVRSLDRPRLVRGGKTVIRRGRILKPYLRPGGYAEVSLCSSGEVKRCRVHVIVMAAFQGHRPGNTVIRHLNGNGHDNRFSNLTYGTAAENMADTISHGNHRQSNKTHCKRGHLLTPENVYSRRWLEHGWRDCNTCHNLRRRVSVERKVLSPSG